MRFALLWCYQVCCRQRRSRAVQGGQLGVIVGFGKGFIRVGKPHACSAALELEFVGPYSECVWCCVLVCSLAG